MKFRFLGGQDCPDWLLAQIAAFSRLTSLKFKTICQLGIVFLTSFGKIDDSNESLKKCLSDTVSLSDLHRFLVAISFILRKSSGYACSSSDLSSEIIQLGLPPEHSKMLARVYENNFEVLQTFVANNIPKESDITVQSVATFGNDVIMTYRQDDQTTSLSSDSKLFQALVKDMASVKHLVDSRFV